MLDQHLSSMQTCSGQIGLVDFESDFGTCTKNVTYPLNKNFLGFLSVYANNKNNKKIQKYIEFKLRRSQGAYRISIKILCTIKKL